MVWLQQVLLVHPHHVAPDLLLRIYRPLGVLVGLRLRIREGISEVKCSRVPREQWHHVHIVANGSREDIYVQLVTQVKDGQEFAQRIGELLCLRRRYPHLVVSRHVENASELCPERRQGPGQGTVGVGDVARENEHIVQELGCVDAAAPLLVGGVVIVDVRQREDLGRLLRPEAVLAKSGPPALGLRRVPVRDEAKADLATAPGRLATLFVIQSLGKGDVGLLIHLAPELSHPEPAVRLRVVIFEFRGSLAVLHRVPPEL
mmetsp:Transcript_96369/g.223461  ORF Transcript_96369/g.223461 Transcript_96369/m.223461 type:complete len:260 (-) Transcript_96369:77-856(-)